MFLALQEAAPRWFDLDPTATPDILGGILYCFFTLAVFSFLYRDNPFYKLSEHFFVGLGPAYFTLQYYDEGILQPVYEYLFDEGAVWDKLQAGGGAIVELGGYSIDPTWALVFRGIAGLLAIMLVMRLFAPNSWMPRWPLAVMVGVYAALKMTGETQSKLVLFVGNMFKTPITNDNLGSWAEVTATEGWRIENWEGFFIFSKVVFFVGLLAALTHFIFTYRRTKVLAGISKVGVITLMITFGAMFGFTVLGRIALLIERVDELKTYTAPGYSLGGMPAAGAEAGVLNAFLTPPILIAVIMVAMLALGIGIKKDGRKTA